MTSTVSRAAPPEVLVRAVNPVLRLLLRSPLHRMLDPSLLLLHVTGRETGQRYDIPVSYARSDGQLVVLTNAAWRASLRGGADVEVTWHGRRRPMRALLEEDPATVAVRYESLIEHLGWPTAGRRLGISTADAHRPTALELTEAARQYGLSIITLTQR